MEEGEIERRGRKRRGEERDQDKRRGVVENKGRACVIPAVAEQGKEEKGRGRESRRDRVGEKCSEMNTPPEGKMQCDKSQSSS